MQLRRATDIRAVDVTTDKAILYNEASAEPICCPAIPRHVPRRCRGTARTTRPLCCPKAGP